MILPDSFLDESVREALGDLVARIDTMPIIPAPPVTDPRRRLLSERYIAALFYLPQRFFVDRPPPWKGARSSARHHHRVKQRR